MCDDQFYTFEECGCDRAVDITWCEDAEKRGQCCPPNQRGRAQQAGGDRTQLEAVCLLQISYTLRDANHAQVVLHFASSSIYASPTRATTRAQYCVDEMGNRKHADSYIHHGL
jgi:hypothetical protein